MVRRVGALLALSVALLAACGDDGAVVDGGASDAGMPDGDVTSVMLDIPWLADGVPPIALAPCPEGWREVPSAEPGGVTTCDPYPEGGPSECPAGQAHFPGEPGCAPVGSPCPPGEWADGLADDGTVVFVRAGATGGDGTRAAPFGRIAEAMAAARDGTTIALAKGRYDQPVAMRLGVTLLGACAAETTLTANTDAVVTARVPRTRVADVTIGPGGFVGVVVDGASAALELEGVVVENATALGVGVVAGATLAARTFVLKGTRSMAGGLYGRGIDVQYSASVTIDRAVLAQNRDVAIGLTDAGSRLWLANTVVRDTQPEEVDREGGTGLMVQNGAAAELHAVVFERNHEVGVLVAGAGAALVMFDGAIRDHLPRARDQIDGRGLGVQSGASAELTRVVVERNHGVGLFCGDDGSRLVLADVIVRDTQPQMSDGLFGRGVGVQEGGSLVADRVLVERNYEGGIFVQGLGAGATLADMVVRDILSTLTLGDFGRGLNVQDDARVEVVRAVIERTQDVGACARDRGRLSLSHAVVRDVLARGCATERCADNPSGHGTTALHGAQLVLDHFVVARSSLCGVLIAGDADADLLHGEVSGNSVGACVQIDGFDVNRLSNDVLYRDNGERIQATTLPVPEPAAPTGG